VLDYDAEGNLVGIDIDHASQKLNLRELVTSHIPLGAKARSLIKVLATAARTDHESPTPLALCPPYRGKSAFYAAFFFVTVFLATMTSGNCTTWGTGSAFPF
jgi:hypothetical protein